VRRGRLPALAFVASLGLALTTASGLAGEELPAKPVPNVGRCPPGYHTNGSQCDPAAGSAFALIRRGPCPPRYRSSGAYCLALKGAGLAVVNTGSCPKGFATAGAYCLDQRSR
jgi:hypothetical protein